MMYPEWLEQPLPAFEGKARKVVCMVDDSGHAPKLYKPGPKKAAMTPHMQVVLDIVKANPGCQMPDINRVYGGKAKNLLWRLTESGYVSFEGKHGKRKYYETAAA